MAKENEAQVVETVEVETVEQTLDTTDDNGQEKSYREIIKALIKDGWKQKKNIKVTNITDTTKDNYTMLTFVVEPPVDAFVLNDSGDYVEGKSKNIYSSNYALSGVLKQTEDLGWLSNLIVAKPKLANFYFNGGHIDVIYKKIAEGEEFVNPFSTNAEPQELEHDTYVYYITNVTLGKNGEETVRENRKAVAAMAMEDFLG